MATELLTAVELKKKRKNKLIRGHCWAEGFGRLENGDPDPDKWGDHPEDDWDKAPTPEMVAFCEAIDEYGFPSIYKPLYVRYENALESLNVSKVKKIKDDPTQE